MILLVLSLILALAPVVDAVLVGDMEVGEWEIIQILVLIEVLALALAFVEVEVVGVKVEEKVRSVKWRVQPLLAHLSPGSHARRILLPRKLSSTPG